MKNFVLKAGVHVVEAEAVDLSNLPVYLKYNERVMIVNLQTGPIYLYRMMI